MTIASLRLNPLILIRVTVGVVMTIHGVARVWLGIVDDFGLFLNSAGFPLGIAVATAITAGELIGGPLLAAGRATRLVASWFIIELLAGIVLVHARDGWFVVGAGRNGIEYSTLLIVCLIAVLVDATNSGNGVRDERAQGPAAETADT